MKAYHRGDDSGASGGDATTNEASFVVRSRIPVQLSQRHLTKDNEGKERAWWRGCGSVVSMGTPFRKERFKQAAPLSSHCCRGIRRLSVPLR